MCSMCLSTSVFDLIILESVSLQCFRDGTRKCYVQCVPEIGRPILCHLTEENAHVMLTTDLLFDPSLMR